MSKISVAMAVCNGEKYLKTQLDSILPQLSEDDELIISVDLSQDKTELLVREYEEKDHRIKVLLNPDPGVDRNFENAIRACSGDYIFLSDQDDWWTPNKVERVLKCFTEEGACLVIHNGVHTDAELNPQGKTFFETYRIGDGKLKNLIKPRYSGCCMAFTKKMKDCILPIPNFRGYDQWVATVCEFCGHISYPVEVLIYHRLHDNNVTPLRSRPLAEILKSRLILIESLTVRLRKIKKEQLLND